MSTRKVFYTEEQIRKMTQKIIVQMYNDNWRPDYIVGLTRGGLIPAVYLSHALNIPMHTLKVSLRDHEDFETNCWMATDAFGYEGTPKNILIIDDINDTGATLEWIVNDWQSGCLPTDPEWDAVWGHNVRFAVLIDNLSSNFSYKVNYAAEEINKAEDDVWIVYPWEV